MYLRSASSRINYLESNLIVNIDDFCSAINQIRMYMRRNMCDEI